MNTAVTGAPPAAPLGAPTGSGAASRPNVLSLSIKDQAGLYAAYMPFLARGGIFVPSNRPFRLGEQVFLVLSLLDRPQKYQIAGQVAWITPAGTPMKTPASAYTSPTTTTGATCAVRWRKSWASCWSPDGPPKPYEDCEDRFAVY